MRFKGGKVVGLGCVELFCEVSQAALFAVNGNGGVPFLFVWIPVHALVFGGVSFALPPISLVLGVACESEMRARVIESIAILVINGLIGMPHQIDMHRNITPTNPSYGIDLPNAAVWKFYYSRTPVERCQKDCISDISDRNVAKRQPDLKEFFRLA